MRQVTRRALIALAVVLAGLLALGALPGYLGSGDPRHLTAEPTDRAAPAANATALDDRRFPYLFAALETGRSEGYRTGRFGAKGAFAHSPFDEFDALRTREPDALFDDGEAIVVEHEGERYRVTITR